MTKARDLSKLLSTANGKIAGANLDVSFENITDTGTEGTRVATGTSAERGSTTGQLRFNTDTGLAEYYTGTAFKSIDAPPTVSSLDVTEVDSQAGGNQTIVISGSGFNSGASVTFVGTSVNFNASTVTVNSGSQITAVAPKASFLNAQEPYGVKVENTSGLSATLASQINVDTSPSWSTASGSLGTVYDSIRTTESLSATATDVDGDTITYSVLSGSLPAGSSLNSSTGAITGFNAVGSSTTSNFTLRATAGSKTADRAFSITVNPPVTQTFSYTGSDQSWTAPTDVSAINVWLWGAGGGSDVSADRGGAGGFVKGTLAVTGGNDYVIVVGQGGAGGDNDANYNNMPTSYGGGGAGYENPSGGGLSGIFSGSGQVFNGYTPQPTDHSRTITIAGGGGGSDNSAPNGGSGGYPNGGSPPAGVGASGIGGSQSAGGADGGGLLKGGSGYTGGRWTGGGGGGYYGGGTGQGNDSAGAGGSSYISNLTNASYNAGSTTDVPDGRSESTYDNNAGYGGQGSSGSASQSNTTYANGGFHGRVVIQY